MGIQISTAHDGLMFSKESNERREILTGQKGNESLVTNGYFLMLDESNAISIGCYRKCK